MSVGYFAMRNRLMTSDFYFEPNRIAHPFDLPENRFLFFMLKNYGVSNIMLVMLCQFAVNSEIRSD